MSSPQPSIPAGAHIGHVHLKVADLDRAVDFYRRCLGFELVTRFGNQAAFLSAGGYHHHIGLNTWESQGGTPHRRGRRGSITSPSTTPSGGTWPPRSSACSTTGGVSMARPTTVPTRRSTCTIRMATGSSWPGIA